MSLQLAPEQVKKIAVAKDLGKLSLAMRSAVGYKRTRATMFGCDVSREIARQSEIASQSTTVVVYTGDKAKEYSVKKHGSNGRSVQLRCVGGGRPLTATVVRLDGDKVKE